MADAPASTRHRAAVLGSPIEHSLSPLLHRAAYADLGLDWQYDAIEVDEHGIKEFLAGLDDSWAGLSLTMPLKERVITVPRRGRRTGGRDPLGQHGPAVRHGWRGTNTDVVGMVRALREAGVSGELQYGTILGAGATARSAVAAMAELGVQTVTVHARNSESSRTVAELAVRLGLDGRTTDLQPDLRALEADVVISTLPGDVAEPWVPFADWCARHAARRVIPPMADAARRRVAHACRRERPGHAALAGRRAGPPDDRHGPQSRRDGCRPACLRASRRDRGQRASGDLEGLRAWSDG